MTRVLYRPRQSGSILSSWPSNTQLDLETGLRIVSDYFRRGAVSARGEAPRRISEEIPMSNRLIAHLAHRRGTYPEARGVARVLLRDVLGLEESAGRGSPSTCAGGASGPTTAFSSPRPRSRGSATSGGGRGARRTSRRRSRNVKRAASARAGTRTAVGHGRAYRYRGPGGQAHESSGRTSVRRTPGDESLFPDRPQRYRRVASPAADRPRHGDDRRPPAGRRVVPGRTRLDLHRVDGASRTRTSPSSRCRPTTRSRTTSG